MVIKLYYQGWDKVSISRFLRLSRPTVDRWITRFESEHFAGLMDHKRGPKAPQAWWFPVMVEVYHLQKRHPDAGSSASGACSRVRTSPCAPSVGLWRSIGRFMMTSRMCGNGPKLAPQPHPYKACRPHEYWFIDGRMMVALDGVKWWSLIMLDGYSRTILAGAVAPVEASWVALMVLYTACLRYGVPETLISDSGGAFTSNEFEAVCTRLEINHEPIESTKGESYKNLMETHFNIQRRLYDYQFSLTTTPMEFEQAHQAFMELYNTTAHQGLIQDHFDPPIPLAVLGRPKGGSIAPKNSAISFPTPSFRARRIRMAVSPCIVIISILRRAYLRRRSCSGCMESSCGPSLTTSSWRSIAAAMTGGPTKSKTSARASLPHAVCLAPGGFAPLRSARVPCVVSPAVWQTAAPSILT